MPHGPRKQKRRTRGALTPGERLAQMRIERGFTQSGLSEVVDIRQSVISEYESGRTRLHAEVLIRFADVFGVSVDELLGRKKRIGRPPIPPGLKILRRTEKLQKLPKSDQTHILKTLDMLIRDAQRRQSRG